MLAKTRKSVTIEERKTVRIRQDSCVFFVVVFNWQTPAYSSTTHKTSTK